MGALHIDTATRCEGDRLVANLSRDWEVWGPNGGYVAAIALRAAGTVAPPDHRPATFSVQYLAVGAFGDADVEVTPVKQGRSAWLINVALRQGERVFLQAQLWTTNRTEGPALLEAKPAEIPPPEALKSVGEYVREHYGEKAGDPPPFWANFECKPVQWWPWEERPPARPPRLAEWYLFKDYKAGDAFLDFCRAVILLDTMIWPAFAGSLDAQADYIAPSLDLTVWFHEPAGAAEWLLVDAKADVAREGLIHGHSRIWTPDGRLVASGGSNLLQTTMRQGA